MICSRVPMGSISVPTSIAASTPAYQPASWGVSPSARPPPYESLNVCSPMVASNGVARPPDAAISATPGAISARDSTPALTPSSISVISSGVSRPLLSWISLNCNSMLSTVFCLTTCSSSSVSIPSCAANDSDMRWASPSIPGGIADIGMRSRMRAGTADSTIANSPPVTNAL